MDAGIVSIIGGKMGVRTTVQIDDALMERVRKLIPPRGFSQFVNDALLARTDAIERERLDRDMIEGYIATRADREELAQDWQIVDGESWPG